MAKKLNIKEFCADNLSFMAKNFVLLSLFGFASFIASFLSLKYVFKHQIGMMFLYTVFCYFFYYVFVSLYYEQKPIFTSKKLVNSLVKMFVVFALSLSAVIFGHLFFKLLKYMAQYLIGFPDIYDFLKNTYHFLNASRMGRFLLYIPMLFLLTFTFFIPGFSWISTINEGDASLWSAYSKTSGNYLKITAVLLLIYAVLPFISAVLIAPTPTYLSISNAVLTIIQLVFCIRLYDFFYKD
ncbi:MAG TPA: hypothetical protein DIC64_04440 [Alphaproteobacteria bacterium]|nr:hypothetical protein [Alphaproteobacteria bacterium]